MIIARLNAWYEANQERRPFRFSPSNLGSCLRLNAFLLWLEEHPEQGLALTPLDAEQLRTFEQGHQRGLALEEACKKIWPDAQSQVHVTLPVGRFKLEGTLDLWIPSERLIVDFKTQGVFGYSLLDAEGPSLQYQLQVHAYRHALSAASMPQGFVGDGSMYVDPVTRVTENIRCLIVYEACDTDGRKGVRRGALKEVEILYTQELEDAYQKRLMEIEGLLIRKEQRTLDPFQVPGLPKTDWHCKMKDGRPLYCAVGPIAGRCHE